METTLASEIRLDHSFNPSTGVWGGSQVLAAENCKLPLTRGGVLNYEWVRSVEKHEGKVRVRLIQGNDKENPLMDEEIKVGKRPVSILQLSYTITEDGVIDDFRCIPGWLLRPPVFANPRDRLKKQTIVHGEGETTALLKEYDHTNSERIRLIQAEYGIIVS